MDDITPPKPNRPTGLADSQPGQTSMRPRPVNNDVMPLSRSSALDNDMPSSPAATSVRPEPITIQEPVGNADEDRQPIFSDGGPSESPATPEPPQKGAGLDLSSLSDEDADDLGIKPPTNDNPSATGTHSKEDYPTGQPKKRGHTGVIVAAILIALSLAGGAGYAYWQNSRKSTPAPTPQQSSNNESAPATVSGDDIDKASSDLDASLQKVDDTADYTANDLSDTTLGL